MTKNIKSHSIISIVIIILVMYFVIYPLATGKFIVRALNTAIEQEDNDKVEFIISHTPTWILNQHPRTKIGNYFLTLIEAPDNYAIQKAAFNNNYLAVKLLIEKGININIYDGYNTPLTSSINGRDNPDTLKVCIILLENGADPNMKDYKDCDILDYCFYSNYFLYEKYTSEDVINLLNAIEKNYVDFNWVEVALKAKEAQAMSVKAGDKRLDNINSKVFEEVEKYCSNRGVKK